MDSSAEAIPERDHDFEPWQYVDCRGLTNHADEYSVAVSPWDWPQELAELELVLTARGVPAPVIARFQRLITLFRVEERSYVHTRGVSK